MRFQAFPPVRQRLVGVSFQGYKITRHQLLGFHHGVVFVAFALLPTFALL
jgi:hypothetical protein